MDSDDEWDAPLARTAEQSHVPLNVIRMGEPPTVGIPEATLVDRINEKSEKLIFPNTHSHWYTLHKDINNNNIISIMQSVNVECCIISAFSMLITEYLKHNSDVNILTIIWPVLRRTIEIMSAHPSVSNFEGVDASSFLETIDSPSGELNGIFEIKNIEEWIKHKCTYPCVSLSFSKHILGHFIAYVPFNKTHGYLLDPSIGSIHRVDIEKLIEYSSNHESCKATKDIICLKYGFNNKLDEYISKIRGIMESGATKKRKKNTKKGKKNTKKGKKNTKKNKTKKNKTKKNKTKKKKVIFNL